MANTFCSRTFAEKKYLLALSVLVCQREGRILLYNARARRMLEACHGSGMAAGTAAIGLGRSVFGVLERSLIVHALE
jgi:DNA polymerase-3 subunit epsilon